MPKLKINRIKDKPKDFCKWLKGEMYERKLYQKDIAKMLNVSQYAVSVKLSSHTFSYTDMLTIFKELGTDQETQIRIML